jgi:hypothetical protein
VRIFLAGATGAIGLRLVPLLVGGWVTGSREYIGFDEATETLRSHFMDNNGSNFTYTWDLEGDTLRIWFGERDSDNYFVGEFEESGDSYRGRWQWPDGRGGTSGYE